MKAIIEVDIPDYQIGQEVSIYFKDTMMIKGIVQEPKIDIRDNRVKDELEPCDCISRQVEDIEEMPSVTPTQNCVENALGALDCISRQAVLNILEREGHKWGNDYRDWVDAVNEVETLPPVTLQEPKKGYWIWCVGSHKCSNCEEYTCFSDKNIPKYCPNCGADMRGEQ